MMKRALLLLGILSAAPSAFALQANPYIPQIGTQANVTLTGSDQTVLAGNAKRQSFRITNNSNAVVYIAYGTAASSNHGMQLPAGATLFDEFYAGAIHAIGSGTGDLTVIESTP